ncbi:chemotaxis protein CheW [Frateuria aurantia]
MSDIQFSPLAQHLTFNLADEEYGVDILAVREIRGWSPVTRIPQAPDYVLGVINLRGSIVPVLDMRVRFGLASAERGNASVTIIVAINERNFGIVVDNVSDVMTITADQIQPVPDMGAVIDTRYLRGLVRHDDRMVLLLDIEKLMKPDDMASLNAALPAGVDAIDAVA